MSDKEPRKRKKKRESQKKDLNAEDVFFPNKKLQEEWQKDSEPEPEEEPVLHEPSVIAKVIFFIIFSLLILATGAVFIALKNADRSIGIISDLETSHGELQAEELPMVFTEDLKLEEKEVTEPELWVEENLPNLEILQEEEMPSYQDIQDTVEDDFTQIIYEEEKSEESEINQHLEINEKESIDFSLEDSEQIYYESVEDIPLPIIEETQDIDRIDSYEVKTEQTEEIFTHSPVEQYIETPEVESFFMETEDKNTEQLTTVSMEASTESISSAHEETVTKEPNEQYKTEVSVDSEHELPSTEKHEKEDKPENDFQFGNDIDKIDRIVDKNLCQLATSMLKYSNIADDFWKKGLDNGLGILMKTVMDIFPLEFSLLTNMCSALSKAGENSSRKVIQFFEKLPGYTEYFENNMETVAPRTSTWILLEDKAPYGTDTFIIPKKTEGIMLTNFPNVDRKSYSVVQWMLTVNGWQICLCEIHLKLQEVSLGAGYVKQQSIQCILDISHLINSILESYPSSRFQLIHITNEFFTILERYSLLPYPSIDLLTMCLNIIRNLSISSPEETWQKCLSINFFPYMIEISQNIPKLASGFYTNNSILGQIVAAVECVIGQYSLLLAFLKLFNEIAKSYQKHIEEESVFLGCLVYILQDIFPSFHKWRYVKHGIKEKIGQLCLDIFHKILFIKKNEKEKKLRIQGVCVYSLLHLASSQALLRIVCTGESTVQQAIQAHVSDGIGQELIVLVHYSLSVLNRLLLMKYRYNENKNELTPISPLEHVLFSQTHHYSQPHVALIVAYYAFQHYSPRLATLAVQLLKRFAKEFPMSLLACLGTEAEAICDHYLLRLSSATEDVRLKEKNLNSCLHSVLEILKDKQKLVYIPEDLHCAAVEFFHALWTRHQLLAEDKLKKNENFWTLLCDPLFQEHQHSRLIAYIIRTLALEVYNTYTFSDNKLDPNVKNVLEKLVKLSLVKLSKFVHHCLNPLLDSDINHSLNISDVSFISEISPDGYILLKCWKDFLLVATKFFKGELTINKNDQISIMEDILESLRLELSNIVNTRTLILLAELYLLLLQKWDCDTFPTWKKWLGFLTELIHNVATNMDSLHPHLQLTIVCMANTSLKIVMKNSDNNELINESVSDWISSVCILLKPSILQAEKAILNVETSQYLQLCVATICLLKDLIEYCQFSNSCLINMQHYMILDILGGLLLIALEQCKGSDIVQTILIFFLSLATNYKAAEIICASGIMQKLCLLLTNTYMINKDGISEVLQVPSKVNLSWLDIYNLVIKLITELLQTLKHSFLQDALNFIGVHVERLYFSLQNVRQSPHSTMIEETLITCKIIYQMSFYQQNWQLYHRISLNLLLKGISESCHATVAYLNRPSLLMYLLEHSKVPSNKQQSVLNMSDIHRYKRLSSIEEVEKPSPQFVKVQMRLLQLLAISLSIMNNISPSLYQVIFDHDLDFGKWTILLPINFSIPSIDQESPMNFGTVMNCINICLRSLIKNDPSSSPEQIHYEKTPQEERHLLLYILEISLSLLLSQAVLCLVHPDIAIHDKQYIRRELGAELSSMTLTMNRYLRKSPLSPASSLVTSSQGHIQTSIFDRPLIKILGPLVDKLFK